MRSNRRESMTRRRIEKFRTFPREQKDEGESLLESLASIIMVGILVVPFVLVVTNSSSWLAMDSQREKALAYARQGAESIRTAVDTGASLPTLTQTMTSTQGVQYTETITSLGSPSWDTTGALGLWKVTVSWTDDGHSVANSLSLQFVADPLVASGGWSGASTQQGGGASSGTSTDGPGSEGGSGANGETTGSGHDSSGGCRWLGYFWNDCGWGIWH